MKYNPSLISKYLSHYAEPDFQAPVQCLPSNFDSVLVIPVYDEPLEQLLKVIEQFSDQAILLIYVFNAPNVANLDRSLFVENKEAQSRTLNVLERLLALTAAERKQNCYYARSGKGLSLMILDYCQEGRLLPAKQGVGLARKLGMDLGLNLSYQQYRKTGYAVDWLHSSDADVSFPDNYFKLSVESKDTSALVYPFQHIAEAGFEEAMSLYDRSLRYYVEQLEKAGSPYAFHTIGSLIAVSPSAYASVRGFPKRSAGEDFYLLNKLAKVGRVKTLSEPTIKVAGRPSHRVPFGTGPALLKIRSLENSGSDYTFYNPRCFKALQGLLDIISNSGQTFASAELLFHQIKDKMGKEEGEAVVQALTALKLNKQMKHLAQKKDVESFVKAFHTWFDAFVTLRFIHELRDRTFPNVSLTALPELDS